VLAGQQLGHAGLKRLAEVFAPWLKAVLVGTMSTGLGPVTLCTSANGTPAVSASVTHVTRKLWKSRTLAYRSPSSRFTHS